MLLATAPYFPRPSPDRCWMMLSRSSRRSIEAISRHVTVIDRALIEQRGDSSVLELLASVAGVHVTQLGGRGGVASVYLRGAEPNFIVVIIDGIKVNDNPNNTRGGSFDFSALSLSQIQRIEIIRGAQSSVYGSDGLSGVIRITTYDSEARSPGVSGEVGLHDLARAAIWQPPLVMTLDWCSSSALKMTAVLLRAANSRHVALFFRWRVILAMRSP